MGNQMSFRRRYRLYKISRIAVRHNETILQRVSRRQRSPSLLDVIWPEATKESDAASPGPPPSQECMDIISKNWLAITALMKKNCADGETPSSVFYQKLMKNIENLDGFSRLDEETVAKLMKVITTIKPNSIQKLIKQFYESNHNTESTEMFEIAGSAVLLTLEECSGKQWFDDLDGLSRNAWSSVVQYVVKCLIIESDLHSRMSSNVTSSKKKGYWPIKVIDIENHGRDFALVTLRMVDDDTRYSFSPGQAMDLGFRFMGSDAVHRRQYTICGSTSPSETFRECRFIVKRSKVKKKNGEISVSNFILDQLNLGSRLRLYGIVGKKALVMSSLLFSRGQHFVFVTAGVGIASIISILTTLVMIKQECNYGAVITARIFHYAKNFKEVEKIYAAYMHGIECDWGDDIKISYILSSDGKSRQERMEHMNQVMSEEEADETRKKNRVATYVSGPVSFRATADKILRKNYNTSVVNHYSFKNK